MAEQSKKNQLHSANVERFEALRHSLDHENLSDNRRTEIIFDLMRLVIHDQGWIWENENEKLVLLSSKVINEHVFSPSVTNQERFMNSRISHLCSLLQTGLVTDNFRMEMFFIVLQMASFKKYDAENEKVFVENLVDALMPSVLACYSPTRGLLNLELYSQFFGNRENSTFWQRVLIDFESRMREFVEATDWIDTNLEQMRYAFPA